MVYTEGIARITARDILYAKEMGCEIKLLGVARLTPEGIEARVHPMLIDSDHPLASVQDSYNAVFVRGDAVQDTMFYGRGAGEMPTASAVVGDVFDCVRNILQIAAEELAVPAIRIFLSAKSVISEANILSGWK